MIVTYLRWKAGFYSSFFFLLNHYIYAVKNKLNYKVISEEWIFKYIDGWNDYFLPIEALSDQSSENQFGRDYHLFDSHMAIGNYKIKEYQDIIPQVYKFNPILESRIVSTKAKLGLDNYDSIFIRRGDKLVGESKVRHASEYLKKLLNIQPDTHKIFVQTDDYNVILELKQYILDNPHIKDIEILTLCPENMRGAIIFQAHKSNIELNNVLPENREYISQNEILMKSYPVEFWSLEHKWEHIVTMLIGVELVRQSRCCVTEYESNVARFIKLQSPEKVYSILEEENNLPEYDKIMCPACGF